MLTGRVVSASPASSLLADGDHAVGTGRGATRMKAGEQWELGPRVLPAACFMATVLAALVVPTGSPELPRVPLPRELPRSGPAVSNWRAAPRAAGPAWRRSKVPGATWAAALGSHGVGDPGAA